MNRRQFFKHLVSAGNFNNRSYELSYNGTNTVLTTQMTKEERKLRDELIEEVSHGWFFVEGYQVYFEESTLHIKPIDEVSFANFAKLCPIGEVTLSKLGENRLNAKKDQHKRAIENHQAHLDDLVREEEFMRYLLKCGNSAEEAQNIVKHKKAIGKWARFFQHNAFQEAFYVANWSISGFYLTTRPNLNVFQWAKSLDLETQTFQWAQIRADNTVVYRCTSKEQLEDFLFLTNQHKLRIPGLHMQAQPAELARQAWDKYTAGPKLKTRKPTPFDYQGEWKGLDRKTQIEKRLKSERFQQQDLVFVTKTEPHGLGSHIAGYYGLILSSKEVSQFEFLPANFKLFTGEVLLLAFSPRTREELKWFFTLVNPKHVPVEDAEDKEYSSLLDKAWDHFCNATIPF